MERAQLAGALEIRPVREMFRGAGWQTAVGSSGTIKAIRDVVTAEGWSDDGITTASLRRLCKAIMDFGGVEAIHLPGLSDERKPVFAGGVAVLASVFKNLGIEHMEVSNQALREGLLYEMLGSSQHIDVQERTIDALIFHYKVDASQARRVENTAMSLYGQVVQAWELGLPQYQAMLSWAARLHEIGLHIAHSQYHKHGAYLIRNSDLPGFSYREQAVLGALVRGHRRKYPLGECNALPPDLQLPTRRLCVLLRLAVLVHRGRSTSSKPIPIVQVKDERIRLSFPGEWLDAHPLTGAELEQEAMRLSDVGFRLDLV
jgi:exopolyphosphatase/guanosine-5'-triphosphate,3'-diphosphate pyrophosphatase